VYQIIYLYIAEDYSFEDKDVTATQSILKKQEEKPNHVDYEIRVYNGTF